MSRNSKAPPSDEDDDDEDDDISRYVICLDRVVAALLLAAAAVCCSSSPGSRFSHASLPGRAFTRVSWSPPSVFVLLVHCLVDLRLLVAIIVAVLVAVLRILRPVSTSRGRQCGAPGGLLLLLVMVEEDLNTPGKHRIANGRSVGRVTHMRPVHASAMDQN